MLKSLLVRNEWINHDLYEGGWGGGVEGKRRVFKIKSIIVLSSALYRLKAPFSLLRRNISMPINLESKSIRFYIYFLVVHVGRTV